MKREINIGDAVDTGQGDYLYLAGKKINDNFSEVYRELGDDNVLFSAGSWKIKTKKDLVKGILNVNYGQSLVLDTTLTPMKIHLPKGGVENVGKVIKLRDVHGSWFKNPIELKPFSGDTIKGKGGYTVINRNFSTIELVYTSKARWEFVETTQIDKHTINEAGSVVTSDFIAIAGQTDFPEPFDAERYNPNGIEVYRRGNKLYYGSEFSEASEYGSIGSNGQLIPLDGNTIKLRDPCSEGDTISFTSYLDGVEVFRTSKNKRSFVMKNKKNIFGEESLPESSNFVVFDEASYQSTINSDGVEKKFINIPLSTFNIHSYDKLNPYTLDILLNGVMLTRLEDYGGEYYCMGATDNKDYESPFTCELNGGKWIADTRDADYSFTFSGSSVDGIEFNFEFKEDDILTLIWYNNIIGTTLSLDEIAVELDKSFINTTNEYYVSHKASIPNYKSYTGLPPQKEVVIDEGEKIVRPNHVDDIMNMVYPIGHVYMNYFNKHSPEQTLGFGEWRRLSGYVLAGFSDDYADTVYGQNNNFLDVNNKPTATPGGTYGAAEVILDKKNIPYNTYDNPVLVADTDGDIDIGACLIDPEDEGLILPKRYTEKMIGIGMESNVEAVSLLQPTAIVSMWVRVA